MTNPLVAPLVELIEICRWKCVPFDEVVLSNGKSNHDALIDAIKAVRATGESECMPLIPPKSGVNGCSIHAARALLDRRKTEFIDGQTLNPL